MEMWQGKADNIRPWVLKLCVSSSGHPEKGWRMQRVAWTLVSLQDASRPSVEGVERLRLKDYLLVMPAQNACREFRTQHPIGSCKVHFVPFEIDWCWAVRRKPRHEKLGGVLLNKAKVKAVGSTLSQVQRPFWAS